MLRVDARLSRVSRVASDVVCWARAPTIRASLLGNGGAAVLNPDVCAWKQAPLHAKLRHSLTAPARGWIRRRRRRGRQKRRRVVKRRNGFTLRKTKIFQIVTVSCEEHFVLWNRGDGGPNVNEWQREHVGRRRSIGLGRRRVLQERQRDGTQRPLPAQTPSRAQQSSLFLLFLCKAVACTWFLRHRSITGDHS